MSLDDLVRIHNASPTFLERFWSKIERGETCWRWTGSIQSMGYGNILAGKGKQILAHRASYILAVGPIPDGMVIDHLCRNTRCVRPDHLEAVTQRVNTIRGTAPLVNLSKTHCPEGHPYDNENTYVYQGRRYCKQCNRDQHRAGNRARATCHPERPHSGHGLCNACLLQRRRADVRPERVDPRA